MQIGLIGLETMGTNVVRRCCGRRQVEEVSAT